MGKNFEVSIDLTTGRNTLVVDLGVLATGVVSSSEDFEQVTINIIASKITTPNPSRATRLRDGSLDATGRGCDGCCAMFCTGDKGCGGGTGGCAGRNFSAIG
jgi:hypothetical protein